MAFCGRTLPNIMTSPLPSPSFNLADLWELVARAIPNRLAVIDNNRRLTYAEVDDRASRLASWMTQRGAGPGSFIGVQMRNSVEVVETSLAAYKIRAVPVNVNFRLKAPELLHLYTDGPVYGVVHDNDLSALVHQVQATVSTRASWALSVGKDYDHALATSAPAEPIPRSADDLYVLYTGGTTGMPKGVVWTVEDAFFGCIGGGDPTGSLGPVVRVEDLIHRLAGSGAFLPAAPLIHAAGMWTTLRWLLAGVTVVLQREFSPDAIWRSVHRERVTTMNIVGDAMARPLADALPRARDLDLSSLKTIASGGAPLSPSSRGRLLDGLPRVVLKDTYGSSETGVHGWSLHTAGGDVNQSRFTVVDTVILRPTTLSTIEAGSPEAGIVARRGRVPLRYHGDQIRSAEVFRTVGAHRYALTGDLALHEADGSITVLGRGSECINSGGEKVFPEEVEGVLRSHESVVDALVVGVEDNLWGQRVAAVVALTTQQTGISSEWAEKLTAHCKAVLAPFKVPKNFVFVAFVHRTVAAKPDYRWARDVAQVLLT
jgi:acyl-CoA synthetase (AMP-forming)/AMP-acid ligase II